MNELLKKTDSGTTTTQYSGTVFIADDDPDILDQLRMILESMSLEVFSADTQEKAEALIASRRPDLVVFDLMMENMDSGFILSHRLKSKYPDVPVIMVSGVAQEAGLRFDTKSSEMQNWIKADVFLDKQIRPEQLKAEVTRLLNANR